MCYDATAMFRHKLTKEQRDFLADKLMDTANWAIGGLVFGQFLEREKHPLELLFGVLFYLWMLVTSLIWKRG